MKRDARGRFVKVEEFMAGRLVDEKMFNLSMYTYTTLNRALDQAQSDVDNVLGGTK